MLKQKSKNFWVLANWMQGFALSGGDRIFIELTKRWSTKMNIEFLVSKDGWGICEREGLKNFHHKIWSSDKLNAFGYILSYPYRTIISILSSFRVPFRENDVVYSSSDFYPDSLPAFFAKLRLKNIKWIAGFYLFAPNPFRKDTPYKNTKWFVGLFYWLSQRPIYWIVKNFADLVFVTSEPDKYKFITKNRGEDKVIVIRGGVDIAPSETYLKSGKATPFEEKKFDACFLGRFHYQKGTFELMDIWKIICQQKPDAKLILIGEGSLERALAKKVDHLGLKNNVIFAGFMNGEPKFDIFKQSRIVVHPATYDSGGMAAAEAMAWALPGVSFDLEALKTYYPRGMVKVPEGDLEQFAQEILKLLSDSSYYLKMAQEARRLIVEEWDWDKRALMILDRIENN
jgi:glycosyltransferase involved in cell wall biosynthesis